VSCESKKKVEMEFMKIYENFALLSQWSGVEVKKKTFMNLHLLIALLFM